MIQSVIHSDPDIQGGVPVFRGTRTPIKNLFDYLEAGDRSDRWPLLRSGRRSRNPQGGSRNRSVVSGQDCHPPVHLATAQVSDLRNHCGSTVDAGHCLEAHRAVLPDVPMRVT